MRLRGFRQVLFACAFVLCPAACCATAFALDPAKKLTQYIHDTWSGRNDYPQSGIGAIAQTRDGHPWLAAQAGLVRFDGVSFTTFDRTNTKEMTHPAVLSLCAARDGSLWFGTFGGGLTRFRNGTFKTYTTKDGLSNNVVYSIVEREDGSLWLGTVGGLNKFQNNVFTAYTTKDGLPHNLVTSIAEDAAGGLWLGTQEGLCRFTGGKFKAYTKADGMPPSYILAMRRAADTGLWIGTKNDGLSHYKDGRFTKYGVAEGLSNDSVRSIYEDRAGTLWVGTEAGGLNRFRGGAFERFTTADGLTSDYVAAIYEDLEGSLWIGANAGGLNRLKDGKFTTFTTEEGLASDNPESIYEDRAGNLWIGTAGGVSRYKDGTFTNFTTKDGLSSDFITSVLEDRAGALWIGTSGGGLNRYQDGKFKTFTTADGLSSSVILTLYEDRAGRLWVAAEGGGINFIEDGKIGGYSTADGLSNNSTRDIHEDRAGNLWIATVDGGINRFRDGAFTNYTTAHGLSDNTVLEIYEDREGVLWLGTQAGGLNRFENGRFVAYNSTNGLIDDVVGKILEDEDGHLWLGGEKGIHRVSKSELNDFAAGKVGRVSHRTYDTTDGMRSSTGRTHSKPGGCKTRDGKLWFPTQKGVVMIDPARIGINEHPPPVYIEEVTADKQSVRASHDAPELPAGTSGIEFRYTGLSFLVPERVRFRYKLEGFDADWVEADARRVAYYTNVPPGSYKFRVAACNNDGVWNEAGASFGFYVRPHFYETNWFYVFIALAFVLGGWLLYRLRVRSMHREFSMVLAERNRISRELHDTVAQEVAGISAQLEAFKAKRQLAPHEADKHLDRARSLARQCLNDARRFVRELRPETIESGGLMNALAVVAEQAGSDATARINLEVGGTPRNLPGEVETNLLRIGQEAIINAVKHAHAHQIDVELDYQPGAVSLRVRDDGVGFTGDGAAGTNGNRFGIIGMHERAAQLGGKLILRSTLHEGTEVSVNVPVK